MDASEALEEPDIRRYEAVMSQVKQTGSAVAELNHRVGRAGRPFLAGERDAASTAATAIATIEKFFGDLWEIPGSLRAMTDDAYLLMTVEELSEPLRELRVVAAQQWPDDRMPNGVVRAIRASAGKLIDGFEEIPSHVLSFAPKVPEQDVRESIIGLVEPYADRLVARKALAQAESARDETLDVLSSAKKAAGEVGSTAQAGYYRDFADSEKKIADWLRVAVIGVSLLIVALTGVILIAIEPGNLMLADLLKLTFVIPLAALAAYLGRESGRHRVSANWARELAMQLQTFDAFVSPLDSESQSALRTKFAAQIFGNSTYPRMEVESGPSVIAEASRLLEVASGLADSKIKRISAQVKKSDGDGS
ncbi:hypothetical protein [Amycolatopsis sp. NPDC051128]|uniref:hypothetical protein n=1 Tax=Amycolatopsis sp. NPDC051128 TaxID=3155412 RepID=UPI00341F5703